MPNDVLTTRALNRALLARQLLLERVNLPIPAALERVGGLQTQYAPAAYIGLWSRLEGFERPMLTRALEDRSAVQATLMRATIHTVSATDYWPMTAGIRRIRREWFANVSRREFDRLDMEAVARATRDALADGPLPIGELTARLEARGHPARTARWVGMWVDLVRVPPSGTWERRRADVFGLAETWLNAATVTEDEGIEHLVRSYLGGFGPAALNDVAAWMGVNVGAVRPVADRLELWRFHDERGKVLLDLPEAPLPDADTPAPVRFLPVWEASLLVHARRTQILPEGYRSRVFNTRTPHSVNTLLVDGQVAGTWRYADGRISVDAFVPLARAARREVNDEAERLAAFHRD